MEGTSLYNQKMISLKEIYQDVFQEQDAQGQSIELPKYNLIVSIMEAEKKLNFSPLDTTKPAPQARTLINQLKQKFKVSLVRQQAGNTFEVTLDPREDLGVVQDFLQNAAV